MILGRIGVLGGGLDRDGLELGEGGRKNASALDGMGNRGLNLENSASLVAVLSC